MQLPPQKQFTLQDLATRWHTPMHHIEEMVRDKEFEYVIEEIGGAQPTTNLVYFDATLYYERTRKQHEHDRDDTIKSRTDKSDREFMELVERRAELLQAILDTKRGKGQACVIPDEKLGFPPSCQLDPHVYPELLKPLRAVLWSPETPQKPYEPSNNGARIYISQSSVEHFEQKHGNCTTPKGNGWEESARGFAKKLLKDDKNLRQDRLAPMVHKLMCAANKEGKTGMTGRGDRVPSVATIRRRALKGIYS